MLVKSISSVSSISPVYTWYGSKRKLFSKKIISKFKVKPRTQVGRQAQTGPHEGGTAGLLNFLNGAGNKAGKHEEREERGVIFHRRCCLCNIWICNAQTKSEKRRNQLTPPCKIYRILWYQVYYTSDKQRGKKKTTHAQCGLTYVSSESRMKPNRTRYKIYTTKHPSSWIYI